MDHSKGVAGAAAMLLACVFAVSSASAEPDGQVRMEDIMFQDLNLTTTAGVDALYQRIHAAALRVCALSGQAELGAAPASAKCTKGAEARAIDKINLPALTAFAANR
jgi:UrcA family protein